MRPRRLELPRGCPHQPLKLARLIPAVNRLVYRKWFPMFLLLYSISLRGCLDYRDVMCLYQGYNCGVLW